MNVRTPCRLDHRPFSILTPRISRKVSQKGAALSKEGSSGPRLALGGLAQLFLSGLAYAEDLANAIQDVDVQKPLPDQLPSPSAESLPKSITENLSNSLTENLPASLPENLPSPEQVSSTLGNGQ